MELSVVLPVHSEGEIVKEVVRKLYDILGAKLKQVIVIVSPASPELTMKICDELKNAYRGVEVHMQRQNPGLGYAFREGFEYATGSHVLIMSSDDETPAESIPLMVDRLEQTGCDIVIASRWVKGGGFEGYDPVKYVLNWGFQTLFRVIFFTRVHDLSFGFKIMRTDVAKSLPWQAAFHDICVETTLLPIKAGYRVEEIPTVWRRRTVGVSKNPFRRNFLYASRALKIAFQKGVSH